MWCGCYSSHHISIIIAFSILPYRISNQLRWRCIWSWSYCHTSMAYSSCQNYRCSSVPAVARDRRRAQGEAFIFNNASIIKASEFYYRSPWQAMEARPAHSIGHRQAVRARCDAQWAGMQSRVRAFRIGLTRSRLQQQVPCKTFPLPSHPTSRPRHHIEHVPELGQPGRAYLSIPSTPTFIPNSYSKWLAAKVRADNASRAISSPWRLIATTGKTGGKTGGKGDSHVKTTKSHSAKAGLQVRQDRVPSTPHPAHPAL